MLKKTMTYIDFDGNKRTEDFYFNLTEAELTEMEYSKEGGLASELERIVKSNDVVEMLPIFKGIILRAYGEKSEDGKRFVKSDDLREAFASTQAYSDLYMELATDDKAANNFIRGIIPASVRNNTDKNNAKKNPKR